MRKHEDRAVIVTGAAGSIGYATAVVLAEEGARLMLVDIAGEKLEEAAAKLRGAGTTVETCRADCSSPGDVQAYVDATIAAFGRIDGFFNNAGVEGIVAPLHEYDLGEFDRILSVNLRGVFLGQRCVTRVMVGQGSGAIVNTASIGSERGLAGGGAYNAAKHGVVGLTRTGASEVGMKGVRINCVEPGVIQTPLLDDVLDQLFDGDVAKGQRVLGNIASQERLGNPREVGTVVSFLLSDDASYVNGVAWPVDGGALATIRH